MPWSSGDSLSPSILNLRQGSATLATGFSTDTLQGQSGLTVDVISDLSVQNTLAAQRIELGGAPSKISGLISLRANSQQSDYLFFQDSLGLKSNFLLGLRTGDSNASLVDGLNLYDASDNTMIVRFSSDSVRFYPPIVAPVFDSGGALASTYNAALFQRGSSRESQIQAAINAASADSIARVYVPASLYPYSAASISFSTRVQMVREGGDWGVHDVRAYGAAGNNVADDTSALSGALGGVGGGTVFNVYVPPGVYRFSSALSPYSSTVLTGVRGASFLSCVNGANILLLQAISKSSIIVDGISWNASAQTGFNTTSLQFDGCTDITVRNNAFLNCKIPIWLRGSSTGCQRVLIENNNFSVVTDHAVRANEASFGTDITIRNNYIADVKAGVIVSPTAFALIANRSNIVNNVVAATVDSGVIASGNIRDVLIAGNMIKSTGISIFVGTGAKRAVVANNIVSASSDFGIDFQGAGAASDEFVASGNIVYDCGKSGINLEDVNRATIVGNTIARSGQATANPDHQRCGISYVQVSNGSVKWTSILGNIIYDDQGSPTMRYGILVQPTNDFTHIWGNSVQDAIVLNYNYVVPTTSYFFQTDTAIRTHSGTALTPVYAFGSESSLGWYRSGSSTLALSYGSLAASVISGTTVVAAQVGIGTTAPAAGFLEDVQGGTDTKIRIHSTQASSNSVSALRLSNTARSWELQNDGTNAQAFRIYDASSAAYRMEISGSAATVAFFAPIGVSNGASVSPEYGWNSERSLGWYRSGVSTVALSYGSFNLNQARLVSVRTQGSLDSTTLAQGELAISIAVASGASLALRSGNTIYYWTSSASTKG